MRSGWYQVAYVKELKNAVTPLEVEKPLIAVKSGTQVRVFDAICPHRGAHLGYGGELTADGIVCPFHAKTIRMGAEKPCAQECGSGYYVNEYQTLTIGGLVFVLIPPADKPDLPNVLRELDQDHFFVPGFTLRVQAPAELIIENGFDATHFHPVHQVCRHPDLAVVESRFGELRATGTFLLPPTKWQQKVTDTNVIPVPYTALGLSPGIILSQLAGESPYWVLTSATPISKKEALLRLSVIVPPGADGKAPSPSSCEYLLSQSQKGLQSDLTIWRHMDHSSPSRYAPEDGAVIEFRRFLNRFPVSA